MTERTPTTQTVLNAYRDAAWSSDNDSNHRYYKWSHTAGLAAALRAAAKSLQSDPSSSSPLCTLLACQDQIYAIADELEGANG